MKLNINTDTIENLRISTDLEFEEIKRQMEKRKSDDGRKLASLKINLEKNLI